MNNEVTRIHINYLFSLKIPRLYKLFEGYDVDEHIIASLIRTLYIKIQGGGPKTKGYRDSDFLDYDLSLRFSTRDRRREFVNLIEENITYAAPIINKLEKRKSNLKSGYVESAKVYH